MVFENGAGVKPMDTIIESGENSKSGEHDHGQNESGMEMNSHSEKDTMKSGHGHNKHMESMDTSMQKMEMHDHPNSKKDTVGRKKNLRI